jgi:predicted ATPase
MLAAKPYLQTVCIRPDANPDYDSYPFNVPSVREMGTIEFHPDVTFFVGENGAGKSTVLEAIAMALGFSPEGGTRNVQLSTEAALSPNRQLTALAAIHQLVQDESQYIIATHSPILLSYPDAKIIQFDGTGLSEVAFEDTEHYAVTRDFLNNYPRRLEQLLGE